MCVLPVISPALPEPGEAWAWGNLIMLSFQECLSHGVLFFLCFVFNALVSLSWVLRKLWKWLLWLFFSDFCFRFIQGSLGNSFYMQYIFCWCMLTFRTISCLFCFDVIGTFLFYFSVFVLFRVLSATSFFFTHSIFLRGIITFLWFIQTDHTFSLLYCEFIIFH